MTRQNVVLIVGDFIIDRTWLVGEPSLAEQHNSHYDVHPRNMVDPAREPDVAGGIGTIARALAAVANGLEIVCVGAWSAYASAEMERRLLPPDCDPSLKKPSSATFRRLIETPFTNLKSRFYLPQVGGAQLKYRFDRNAENVDPSRVPDYDAIDWPDPNDVRLVILGDYGYGMLKAPKLKQRLSRYARKAPVILRSYDKDIIEAYSYWNLLTMNLHLFARYVGREGGFEPPVIKQVDGRCRYHPLLIEELARCPAVKKHPHSALLINLEQEGAIVVHNGNVMPYILSTAGEGLNIGIGANDVVLAHVANGLLNTGGSFEEQLRTTADAVRAGSFFGARARQLDLIPGWYAPKLTVTKAEIANATPLLKREMEPLPPRVDILDELRSPDASPMIRLHDASWYLDGFLTVDSTLGGEIIALKAKIAEYVRSDRHKRPFVALLCGDPGAGKTTLAQRIGKVTGCDVIIENAAQWTSAEDLFLACERIRSARMRGNIPLAFIDEVDSQSINGQHLYGKLLSPIWDGAYFIQGEERTLGHPTVFLLAGSTREWKNRRELDKAARKQRTDKLPDLVSRLSWLPVNITPLSSRQADIVYMAAWHIVRNFARVTAAHRGIFRLFTESKLRHGARSIAAVIDLFHRPKDERWLATSDLPRDSALELHIEKPPRDWRDDDLLIAINP